MCTANEAQDMEYAGRLSDGDNPSHFILSLNKLYLNYFNNLNIQLYLNYFNFENNVV